jgi:hypothetical protein
MSDEAGSDANESLDLNRILREAKAPWQQDGSGVRGSPRTISRQPDPPPGGRWPLKIEQSPETPPFPTITPPAQTVDDSEEATGDQNNEYGFELELDAPKGVKAIDVDAGTAKIHVGYGEINDTPPDGMTGDDDYFLTISVDGTEIWAVVTYDTSTLEITSRSLNFGASVPASTFGTLYIPIGFVDISYDPATGKIKEVNPHNRQCGDINISFVYGSANAAPALFYLSQFGDPEAVP